MHHCQSGRVFLLIRSKEDADIFYNEHQHSSLRLNYTFLNTFPQNPVFSDWVSVFKRERTVWNTSLHPPLSPSLPLSLPRCLPLQSSSRPALLSAAMAAEAAGRDDATAGPADCTEMGERVRCFFCLFFFFSGSFRMLSLQKPTGWRSVLRHRASPGCGTAAAAEMERNSAAPQRH